MTWSYNADMEGTTIVPTNGWERVPAGISWCHACSQRVAAHLVAGMWLWMSSLNPSCWTPGGFKELSPTLWSASQRQIRGSFLRNLEAFHLELMFSARVVFVAFCSMCHRGEEKNPITLITKGSGVANSSQTRRERKPSVWIYLQQTFCLPPCFSEMWCPGVGTPLWNLSHNHGGHVGFLYHTDFNHQRM